MAIFVAERMDHVSVVALKDDLDGVLRGAAGLHVLHPSRVEDAHGWAARLAGAGVEGASAEYLRREHQVQQICEGLGAKPVSCAVARPGPLALEEVDRRLGLVEARVGPLLARRTEMADTRSHRHSLLQQLGDLLPPGVPLHDLMHSSFLVTAVGAVPKAQVAALVVALSKVPSVVLPYRDEGERRRVLCIVLRRDSEVLDGALRAAQFEAAPAPEDLGQVSAETVAKLEREQEELDSHMAALQRDIDAARVAVAPELAELSAGIRAAQVLLRMESYCRGTDSTSLFSGWVPRNRTGELVQALRDRTGGRAVIEVDAAESLEAELASAVDVPVMMDTPPFLRPFRALTEGFGVPTYHMVDPTVFVAITFLFMFGMMFGDVGQGAVLVAGGVILVMKWPAHADMGKLGMYCGISSMIFGLLYGSVFGIEGLIPALWLHPLEHVTTLFATAIGFGVVFISTGFLLNIAHAARRGALVSEFFDASGPLIVVAYWAGVGLAVRALTSSAAAPNSTLLALVLIPLVLLFAKGPILRVLGRQARAFPEGIGVYLMESLVEILEVLMGCVANTVSFIRVAAFGLAHAGLFLAVFGIAGTLSEGTLGPVLSLLVVVIGNVVIILLEGLIVVIQAMRLEYYEFFGKFFKESGTKFEPLGFS